MINLLEKEKHESSQYSKEIFLFISIFFFLQMMLLDELMAIILDIPLPNKWRMGGWESYIYVSLSKLGWKRIQSSASVELAKC